MAHTHVLALDQGTTSSRALVFNHLGQAVSVAQQEFPQYYPRSGWVEHAPEDLWESTRRVALASLAEANLVASDLAALGLTNQRETTLLWEKRTGTPLARAIVWQDRRTSDRCSRLQRQGLTEAIREKTGLLTDPYFSATKIAWLLDSLPGARKRAQRGELAFGTVDTWLLWKLTSGRVHATDPSNASRTLLMNLKTCDWDEELLSWFRVPREILPEIRPTSGCFGEISSLPALNGTPILGMAGDQQAALFGQTCFAAGEAKNTYGTGCFLLLNTGTEPRVSKHRLLTTVAWKLGSGQAVHYALEGSVFIGGAVVQWLRDGLGLISSSSEIEELAAKAEDNGGVYFVPAFTGLGAPHWDPQARGAIFGLTRGTRAEHLARAALESIAYQCADVLDAMQADAGTKLRELRVDGGATANKALLQFQADLLKVAVIRPNVRETTALGAAFLAGLASGFWKDQTALRHLWKPDLLLKPSRASAKMRTQQQRWRKAVERSKTWD